MYCPHIPTLEGELSATPGPEQPGRWCGAPTDLVFAPEGSRIGPVPLHMLCGATFIRAYQRMQAGSMLTAREQERLARFTQPQLSDGHAAASSATALQREQPIR